MPPPTGLKQGVGHCSSPSKGQASYTLGAAMAGTRWLRKSFRGFNHQQPNHRMLSWMWFWGESKCHAPKPRRHLIGLARQPIHRCAAWWFTSLQWSRTSSGFGQNHVEIDTLTISDTVLTLLVNRTRPAGRSHLRERQEALPTVRSIWSKINHGIAGVRGTKFTLGADGSAGDPTRCLACLWRFRRPNHHSSARGTQYDPATGKSGPLSTDTLNLLNEIAAAAGTAILKLFPMYRLRQ